MSEDADPTMAAEDEKALDTDSSDDSKTQTFSAPWLALSSRGWRMEMTWEESAEDPSGFL
jgi:hypothetical protein